MKLSIHVNEQTASLFVSKMPQQNIPRRRGMPLDPLLLLPKKFIACLWGEAKVKVGDHERFPLNKREGAEKSLYVASGSRGINPLTLLSRPLPSLTMDYFTHPPPPQFFGGSVTVSKRRPPKRGGGSSRGSRSSKKVFCLRAHRI